MEKWLGEMGEWQELQERQKKGRGKQPKGEGDEKAGPRPILSASS